MTQVKPTQIIPGRQSKVNPASSLPVDLDPAQRGLILDPVTTVEEPPSNEGGDPIFSDDSVLESTESMLLESDPTPATPAIISVKEQIVKFMPDGTAKIDIVLEIQDIDEAVEYDIRVAKDAGNV